MDIYYNIYGYLLDLTISVHQKFEHTTDTPACFCSIMSEVSTGKTQKPGAEINWSFDHSGILILMLAIS